MKITTDFLKKKLITKTGRVLPRLLTDEELDWLRTKFPFNLSKNALVYLLLHDLPEPPRCHCGNYCEFKDLRAGFKTFCCHEHYVPPARSEEAKRKTKETVRARYGAENVFASQAVKERIKSTMRERYGVDAYTQTDEYRERVCQNHHLRRADVRNKIKATNLEKYGCETAIQSETVREKARRARRLSSFRKKREALERHFTLNFSETDYVAAAGKYVKFSFTCRACGTTFDDDLANGLLPLCPTCNPRALGASRAEEELFELLTNELGLEVKRHDRTTIAPLELDLFISSHKLAIEFNGLYWHSARFKPKNYHLQKLEVALSAGIRLIQIFEDEWNLKRELVVSRIKHALGLSERVHARACELQQVTGQQAAEFFDKNHLQGSAVASVSVGLFFNSELVACASFRRPRFTDEADWELIRYASRAGMTAVGGFSRLLSWFVKTHQPSSILSYADRRWSEGKLYETAGFKLKRVTAPGYSYVINGRRVNRLRLTKANLSKLRGYDSTLTERENARLLLGAERVWDCGQLVYVLE